VKRRTFCTGAVQLFGALLTARALPYSAFLDDPPAENFDLPQPGYVGSLAFLDESTLLCAVDREILRWNINSREEVGARLTQIPSDSHEPLPISDVVCANQRYVAVATSRAGVFVRDMSNDAAVLNLPHDIASTARNVAFSEDGKLFAAAFDNGHIGVWSTNPWRFERESMILDRGISMMALSGDGSAIITAGSVAAAPGANPPGTRTVVRFLATNTLTATNDVVLGNVPFLGSLAGGRSTFAYVLQGLTPIVHVTDLNGKQIRQKLYGQHYVVAGLRYRPGTNSLGISVTGGDPVVSLDRGVNLYGDVGTLDFTLVKGFPANESGTLAFSPKGRHLAIAKGKSVTVWKNIAPQ